MICICVYICLFLLSLQGNIWATGPGGVVVLTPQGQHLGTILTGVKTGNVAFGSDGYLYIAANSMVQRIRVTATGAAV
jgi:gluconolactonase